MNIDKNSFTPAYVQLKEQLREKIHKGEYLPNQTIPSAEDFSQKYGISKVTVRQAFNDLIKEEFLYGVRGKGTFVAESKPKKQARAISLLFSDIAYFLHEVVKGIEEIALGAKTVKQALDEIEKEGNKILGSR